MNPVKNRGGALEQFGRRTQDADADRELPKNLEAEAAVLGVVLVQNEVLNDVAAILEPTHLFRHAHQVILARMITLGQHGQPIDLITLGAELSRTNSLDDVGGPAYIASLTDGVPRMTNVLHYARIVRDLADRRAVIRFAAEMAAQSYDLSVEMTSQLALARQRFDAMAATTPTGRAVSEPLPKLAARLSDSAPRPPLVEGLIPGDGLVLLHSQPREYKSMTAQSLMLAVTAGIPAFGLARLRVPSKTPAWYISEEDSAPRVTERLIHLARGIGLDELPPGLHVSAGVGVSLDDPACQEELIANTRRHQFGLVVLDPLRSLTETADQGPRELKPLVLFLRRFIRETGAVVLIVHHDTKLGAFGKDNRRRPQRASGGGIFSIADAPMHVERLKDGTRILVPTDYKFMTDPPRVVLRLEQGPGWLRLAGSDEVEGRQLGPSGRLSDRIVSHLVRHPNSSGTAVAKGVRAAKGAVLDELKHLEATCRVASVSEGNATRWRPLCEDDAAGSVSSPPVPEPTNR